MNISDKSTSVVRSERLLSLDALRGFDMIWIIGGGSVVEVLAEITHTHWLETLAKQMKHVEWEGFHFYDLIFPLFMFIAGIAIPLSVHSKLSLNITKKALFLKVFKRMVILVFLGILYNGALRDGFTDARYVSVLGQIGIAYFFASTILIFSKSFKASLLWLFGILLGVTLLQLFIPVPGIGAGILTPEGHMNGYLDRLFLPGRLDYGNGTYDALGLLSIVSATGITLMGAIAGNILQRQNLTPNRKTTILLIIGIILTICALGLSPFYPIIKNCWTSTFNLLAGGISFLLFALFYLIIDVWHIQKWSFFFRIIGLNSIFIYLLIRIVPVMAISGYFIGWITKPMESTGELISVLACLIGEWLLLYFMYKKKIFIKV